MEQHRKVPHTIDEYIATFPESIQALLESVRATIKAAAPEAKEIISYQMPAFALNGNLVYFSVLKNHIGFYPTASGVAAFTDELATYKGTKAAVNFPFDAPLPLELIGRIVQFRVQENLAKAEIKANKKNPSRK